MIFTAEVAENAKEDLSVKMKMGRIVSQNSSMSLLIKM